MKIFSNIAINRDWNFRRTRRGWFTPTAVPHAALSGQYALEQTYIVPVEALVAKDKAPINVLEAICKRTLSV